MTEPGGINWIQHEMMDLKLYRAGARGVDLDRNGALDNSEKLATFKNNTIPGNDRATIGDWTDWLAFYRWNANKFTKLGGIFSWAGKLKPTNPLHLITLIESYVGDKAYVKRTYKKVVEVVNRLKNSVSPEANPRDKLTALYSAMKLVGLLRQARYPLVIEEMNRTPLNPVATSLIAVAIAHEMDWPLHAVRAPKHVFNRWVSPGVALNVDQGVFHTDEHYMALYKLDPFMIRKSVYLRSLGLKGLVALILRMRGEARYYRDDLEGAESDLTAALKIDYYYVRAWHILGIVKGDLARGSRSRAKALEAVKAFTTALKLNPQYVDAWNGRGNIYLDALEMPKEAIEDFNKALALQADYHNATYNRGRAYFQLMNYDAALKDFTSVGPHMPRQGHLHNFLGLVYAELFEPAQAIAQFTTAIAQASTDANKSEFASNLARLYHRQGNRKMAATYYALAVKHNPRDSVAWFKLGTVNEEMRQWLNAIKYYGKAIRLANNRYARAFVQRARVYMRLGDYMRAAMDLRSAKTLDEDIVDPKLLEAVRKRALER